ncbi:MAG: TPM domain-containing protein [Bacteroidetes bacterium]|nr:MAG: TPM domain-containing protein [Bacteroidota bacterium]
MKHLFIFLLALGIGSCIQEPKRVPPPFVLDREELLSDEEEELLYSLCAKHEQGTGNEILILTTPDLGDSDTALVYATRVGQVMGVGKTDKNNGVVILLSKGKKQVAIAEGLGLEKILSEDITSALVDTLMLPKASNGEYYEVMKGTAVAITGFLEGK